MSSPLVIFVRGPAKVPALAALATAAVAAACAEEPVRQPPPVDPEVLASEHEEWRERRRRGLANPNGGVVSWVGLWELREGANPFGSDPSLRIVLPPGDSPPLAGTLHLAAGGAGVDGPDRADAPDAADAADAPDAADSEGAEAAGLRLVPEAGGGLALRDGGLLDGPVAVAHDRSGNTTYLTLGSLGLRVHAERGTARLWLRAWDTDSPRAAAFELPPYFRVNPEWRLAARFDAYSQPRQVPMADVTGGTVANVSPGELVFHAGGREHRLIAFATESSRDFLVMLRDSTAFTETYQLGRYMRVPFPDDDGWTVIDFNRAYNPPCAFTPHSVCSFPPRENRLELSIGAGEKRPAIPASDQVR